MVSLHQWSSACPAGWSEDTVGFSLLFRFLFNIGTTSGAGLHEMRKGSVRAAIASESYLSDVEVKLHNMHMHDQVFITNNDEHVEEIAMKQ